MKKTWNRRIWIIALCVVLSLVLVVFPTVSVIIYEVSFARRYTTPAWQDFDVSDFEGLSARRSDFLSDGVMLAGYCYSKENVQPKGVVIFAHGMGGGGHAGYLPLIDRIAEEGCAVFAYDARGNDESGGYGVKGLPQSVVDLDHAIDHVRGMAEFEALPLLLVGHSWGGYAVGAVLGLQDDVAAAVILAGFNESEDLLLYQGQQFTGTSGKLLLPYFQLYERIKFGAEYTDLCAVESMENADAEILIVHSIEDDTVPVTCGYDLFYEAFGDDPRFHFVLYEGKGHGYLYCSDEALDAQRAAEFDPQKMDRDECLQLDENLMEQILTLFETSCDHL